MIEARRVARAERRDQAGDAADQKQPADENIDGDRRDRRHDDGKRAENDQHNSFDQKQDPMLANGL